MSLNESTHSLKDRWPLEFDLEGITRESDERERLLQQKLMIESMESQMAPKVSNTFAVDYQQGNNVMDINNPPKKPYVYQEYPKLIHGPSGTYKLVESEKEEKEHLKRGFTLKPQVKEQVAE